MRNLNDLVFFTAVVDHNGFTAAARALGIAKSRLSRSVSDLEQELGLRLLERSTRAMRLTDVGQSFYEQCKVVREAVETAETIVAQAQARPAGALRVACPPGILHQSLAAQLPRFTADHPQVRLLLTATNRRVDLVEEHFDVALRVRSALDTDPNHIVRVLGESRIWLVASPEWRAAHPQLSIDTLADHPTLSPMEMPEPHRVQLVGPNGQLRELHHLPRISCSDFEVVRQAAMAGQGVALMPNHTCRADVQAGRLARVLNDWASAPSTVHLVYTSRRGQRPAVRAFIDFAVTALSPVFAPITEC